MESDAIISGCGQYRHSLTRKWGPGPTCVFIMLNPSTADAVEDDPTIRRCIGFAQREGCGSLEVVNLFGFRATSPADLKRAADPVGRWNDQYLYAAVKFATGPVIAAWGAHGAWMDQSRKVRQMLRTKPLKCLGLTKAGEPKHPLYLPGDAPLINFNHCAAMELGVEA